MNILSNCQTIGIKEFPSILRDLLLSQNKSNLYFAPLGGGACLMIEEESKSLDFNSTYIRLSFESALFDFLHNINDLEKKSSNNLFIFEELEYASKEDIQNIKKIIETQKIGNLQLDKNNKILFLSKHLNKETIGHISDDLISNMDNIFLAENL